MRFKVQMVLKNFASHLSSKIGIISIKSKCNLEDFNITGSDTMLLVINDHDASVASSLIQF